MMGIKTGIGQGTSAFNKEIRLRIGAGIRLWTRVNQNKGNIQFRVRRLTGSPGLLIIRGHDNP